MSVAARRNEEFISVLPAINARSEEIIVSLRESGAINALCDAIVADLKGLCSHAKEVGAERLVGLDGNLTTSFIGSGPFAGSYIGIGIGKGWLGFGPFESEVISILRKRFEDQHAEFERRDSDEFETLSGSLILHEELYRTHDGVFELSHTYAWFVKRRVD